MEQLTKCQKVIEQINSHSADQYLLTTNIGEGTGVRGRSGLFCFDRLWASGNC